LSVSIRQSNIPFEYLKFRSQNDIFLKVELIGYNIESKRWTMKVIDYSVEDIKNFERQKSTKEIEKIVFERVDWLQFEKLLTHYQKAKLIDFIYNHDIKRYTKEGSDDKTSFPILSKMPMKKTDDSIKQPYIKSTELEPTNYEMKIRTFNFEFKIYFTDAIFSLGYVAFSKYIFELGKNVDFKIKNENILAEFDNIKSGFAKILKTRKFKVYATITAADRKITDIKAESPEISRINEELIESVKYQRTISWIKSPKILDTDKSLFTAEDIFDEMKSNDIEGNIFKQSEQDILKFMLDNHKTRNKKHLEYLSGSKHSEKSKLKFTLQPSFGFLFLIEGKENNHFVWELLNSHATYIWSIGKSEQDIDLQYKRIEVTINSIRESGREKYKRAYRQNHLDNDLVFCVIEHDAISSNLVDGFVKWKHKLNEMLI
jgi:hypothetical protein